MNKVITALIIGVAIILAGFIIGGTVEYPIGATSGPDYYDRQNFFGGLVDGGEVTTLTTGTTTSITAKQVCDSAVVNWLPSDPTAATTTFPGAAAMNTQCLMQNGASKTFLFRNTNTLTASTTVFVVASTTSDTLLMPEATGADVIIDGAQSALVTFVRTAASTVVITVTELINGD